MSQLSSIAYHMLDGEWPVLDQAPRVPTSASNHVITIGNGSAITTNIGYFSLGKFYIDTTLLMPHPTQRPIESRHVDSLKESFHTLGPMRTENHGVVIGLGEGWYRMKNNGPRAYMISKSCPHLHHLRDTPDGCIGEIIRGNHRTEAIRRYSSQVDPPLFHENYWYYEVLVPSKSIKNMLICKLTLLCK